MRARWRERVCPAALFTLQQREMGLPLPVCWDSIYEKVQSRCLCESDSPIVSPGVRLCACIRRVCGCPLASLAQTVQYSLWFSVKKKTPKKKPHRRSESPERPWDIWGTHLHYLIFSQEMARYFSTVVCRDRSLRLGLRWITEVRQQVTVCF